MVVGTDQILLIVMLFHPLFLYRNNFILVTSHLIYSTCFPFGGGGLLLNFDFCFLKKGNQPV